MSFSLPKGFPTIQEISEDLWCILCNAKSREVRPSLVAYCFLHYNVESPRQCKYDHILEDLQHLIQVILMAIMMNYRETLIIIILFDVNFIEFFKNIDELKHSHYNFTFLWKKKNLQILFILKY